MRSYHFSKMAARARGVADSANVAVNTRVPAGRQKQRRDDDVATAHGLAL
jgi:hypothetical protein